MADSLSPHIVLPETAAVCLRSAAVTTEWNWLLEQYLTDMLQKRGVVIFFNNQPSASSLPCYRLEYWPLDLRIGYKRSSVLKKMLQRSLHIEFAVRILDAENRLLFSQILSRDSQDVIGRKDLAAVENSALPFTVGKMESRPLFERMIEPLVISCVTGGIIYLFYSMRTQS